MIPSNAAATRTSTKVNPGWPMGGWPPGDKSAFVRRDCSVLHFITVALGSVPLATVLTLLGSGRPGESGQGTNVSPVVVLKAIQGIPRGSSLFSVDPTRHPTSKHQ